MSHLPAVLELLAQLGTTIGPSIPTTVVPLGRSHEEANTAVQQSPTKPSNCHVAAAVRPLPTETSRALAQGTLIWTVPGCEDQLAYFQSLVKI